MIIVVIGVGGIVYTNMNKHLHVDVFASESNSYGIKVKGSKKYYNVSKENLDIGSKYIKIMNLNNFDNEVSIYNKSRDKILDIRILDNKTNNEVDQINSVYPDTLWTVDLSSGDYTVMIKVSEYVKK